MGEMGANEVGERGKYSLTEVTECDGVCERVDEVDVAVDELLLCCLV